jgi:hypothetical protein
VTTAHSPVPVSSRVKIKRINAEIHTSVARHRKHAEMYQVLQLNFKDKYPFHTSDTSKNLLET